VEFDESTSHATSDMGSILEKNSESVRKRIEAHKFQDEEGDEYGGSKFGGFADYFRRKKIKLQNLDAEVRSSSGEPQIFRGIVAHVNGYTQPSLNDLHHLIVSHGGGFMQYLDGKTTVTHIIAANLTPKKAIEFRRYRIVKPAWVVDSVNAGKLLPWDAYRVLDEGVGQRVLRFDGGKVVNQANSQQRGYRDQTNTSWYTSQVQNIADDIDHEDGPQFPKAQQVVVNGNYETQSQDQPWESIEVSTLKAASDDPFSSLEVTSSLEDVLNQVASSQQTKVPVSGNNRDILLEFDRPSEPLEAPQGFQTPSKAESFSHLDDGSPDIATPSKVGDFPDRKRFHETETPSPSKRAKMMTAEEHNALLLQDPHIRKSSTANPDFIKQYYSESRLHHLSTWKADLKSRFQRMAEEKSASQKAPVKRKPGSRRYIMHVDFDSFFCAVSLKSAPECVDKPAVVAHGNGTGSEIASCNYPAREFGVKNGMWMKQALKLCPDIKVLPYDFPAYEEASNGFYEAILDVGGIVQSVSVDEALVDITSLCLPAGGTDGFGISEGSIWREQEKADEIADRLRKRIKEKTGCAVSIGIGGNILLAKVALRKAKPAGQHQVKPEEVLDFVGELSVQNLPGVAYSIGGKLEELGIKFVKDVRQLTKERLMTVLGPKTGEKIWDYSRGIDKTEVGEQVVRKSVSAEVNWGIRFISQPEAEEFVQNLCIELQKRLVEQKVKGRQLTMKIMKKAADAPLDPPKHLGHGKCDTYNKSIVLGVATNSADITGREAISILRGYGFSPGELRGLGVQMTKLEPLKAIDELAAGSQRRIYFGKPTPKLNKYIAEDPINDPESPKKSRITPQTSRAKVAEDSIDESATPQKPKSSVPRFLHSDDPIDEINSPVKTKDTPVHPAASITRANAADQSARKLNLTGTQFIIPTQIDPAVLAELPLDIRSKLMAQSKRTTSRSQSPFIKHRSESPAFTSRAQSPAFASRVQSPAPESNLQIPPHFDAEVFESLPEDVKAEVLASYSIHPQPAPGAQSLLPQSPRKPKPLPQKKWTPTKKRGRPAGSKNKKEDPYATSLQSKFALGKSKDLVSEDGEEDAELDPEFLSALPEEMRAEIVAEHKRKRLARKGGLMTNAIKRRKVPEKQVGQRRLRLEKRENRPTFTTKELWREEELRGMLREWTEGFREEGPDRDDVGALERYLRRVVGDERDMGKARGVVRWLGWLVSEMDGRDDNQEGKSLWESAVEHIRNAVQEAVRERGLGALDL
jgi:DNA repair protein REV1